MKTKVFYFENRVFLIPDLYFYDIKIQTNLSLNDIKNHLENHKLKKTYIYNNNNKKKNKQEQKRKK
jgi:hypothetical protein